MRKYLSISYDDFLTIDNVEGRFFSELDLYWLLVKEYGFMLVNSASHKELLEMYSCIASERACVVTREMYMSSKPEESYVEYLNKVKRMSVIISDFEKSEIEEIFKEVK